METKAGARERNIKVWVRKVFFSFRIFEHRDKYMDFKACSTRAEGGLRVKGGGISFDISVVRVWSLVMY